MPSVPSIRSLREKATAWNRRRVRNRYADRYLSGKGIEIGALHQPQRLPAGAEVRYLDRLDNESLRREYPELDELDLAPVDIVEDGEDPRSIPDESVDFVIASHVIEHCEDPLGTILNWLRILRTGGRIFLVVPDRRRTFDRDRLPQTSDHLLVDHTRGPEGSRSGHYRDWVKAARPDASPAEVEAEAARLEEQGYRIHFHVWTREEFTAAIEDFVESESIPVRVVAEGRNFREFIVLLEKTPEDGP